MIKLKIKDARNGENTVCKGGTKNMSNNEFTVLVRACFSILRDSSKCTKEEIFKLLDEVYTEVMNEKDNYNNPLIKK